MRGYMFRNRWFALLFVGLVLAGVTRLVGTGNGDGAIDLAKGQLAQQKAQAEALTNGAPTTVKPSKIEFVSDEELIDPAVGEDPTPIDQRVSEEDEKAAEENSDEVPHDTVILVSQDASAPGPAPAPAPAQ